MYRIAHELTDFKAISFDVLKPLILETAKKHNIFASIHNGSTEYALKMIDNGFDLVKSMGNDVDLKIYPNPSSNKVYFTLNTGDIATLYVFDVLGKLIFDTNVTYASPSVDISTLSNGMYIVKIQSSNKSKTIKLIKQ